MSVPGTAAALAAHAAARPDSVALLEPPRQVSYRQLALQVAAAVTALERIGITPGMRVGVEVRPDRALHLVLLLACEVIGATTLAVTAADLAAPADPALRGCARLLVTAAAPAAAQAERIPPDWLQSLPPCDADESERILRRPPPAAGLVRIVRTSGTTGRPKAIGMSFTAQQRILDTAIARVATDVGAQPRFLSIYGLGFRASVTRVLQTLQCGGSVLFATEAQAPAMIAAGLVNHLMFLVGDAKRIVARGSPPPRGHRLHVELVGASADKPLRAAFTERFGATVTACYSTNETNLISFVDADGVGRLCPGVAARIVDEAGRDLPHGAVGVIRVRTAVMTDAYVDDPAASAAAFIDGWYHTNDMGRMPDASTLVVLGRADDMLNVGGIKFLPQPIEATLKRVPGVRDAVLVALDHADRASRVVAAIEIGAERVPPGVTEAVRAAMAGGVPGAEVVPVPWFPRTETGKVQRAELRAALARRDGA